MEYKYFISWSYPKGNGCSVFERDRAIKSFEDLQELINDIERESKISNVVIMNFIKL